MPSGSPDAALYLDTVQQVDQFLSEIAHVKELALDTEGASFHRFLLAVRLAALRGTRT